SIIDALSLFFFFSSRRRHTRLQGDWSSDVCSSDLTTYGAIRDLAERLRSDGRKPYVVPYGVSNPLGAAGYASTIAEIAATNIDRSEERRVGKECRCRGWRDD